MHSVTVSKGENYLRHEPYVTIDDTIRLAEVLVARLNKLGEYRHPLAVIKGVTRQIMAQDESKILKTGSKTYFFDIKATKEGKLFLVVTESRFKGEGKERERASIVVFPEHAQEFIDSLREMIGKLG